jgi:membrane protein
MKKNTIKQTFENLKSFFQRDLWRTDLNPLSKKKRFSFISLRVLSMILGGFKKDKCSTYAAALTNITVMSLVPTLAFMFAIAQGFKFYAQIEEKLLNELNNLPSGVGELLIGLLQKLQQTDLSTLGVIGLAIMFWTVITLMGKIEGTFNHIWGIKTDRDFITKCKEYFFILMIVPTILLITGSITATLNSQKLTTSLQENFGDLFIIYEVMLIFIAPLTTAFAFTYLYKFLPNTKVKLIPAFIAGVTTTLLWQLLQWAHIKFQLGASDFNAVYGTFATIPLFMGWLYMSWMVILFGAELSFAIQNHDTFEDESRSEEYSFKTQLSLALYLSRDLASSFHKGETWYAPVVLQRLKIPIRFGNKVLDLLCKGGIMKVVSVQDGEYLPAKDLHSMNLKDVQQAIFGIEDKLLDNIKEVNSREFLEMNNKKIAAYGEELSHMNLFELVDDNEISNKKV